MNTLAICTDREDSIKDYHTAINYLKIVDDVYPQLEREWQCISSLVDNYLLASKLNYLSVNFPETKFLHEYYSDEAWKVTEAISRILERIKNFFTRTIQYIKVFVTIRVGAAGEVIKAWAEKCESEKKEDIEEYLNKNEKKDMSADGLNELMWSATKLYKDFQDVFTKISRMTVSQATSSNNAEDLVQDPASYKTWTEQLEKVEDENPRNKQTNGKNAKTLVDGSWGDASVLKRLAKACETVRVVTADLNKLNNAAKDMISELSKSDNTPSSQKTDNDGGAAKVQAEDVVKKRKLAFLKKFSNVFMQKLISTFVRYSSHAGNQCQQLLDGYDKTAKKLTASETA